MATFKYEALDARGETVKGMVEGNQPRQVRALLREKGLMPLSVESFNGERRPFQIRLSWNRGISSANLAILTRQFSTLIKAGLPLEECLTALAEQTESARIRGILSGLKGRVLEGVSLARAMESYPKAFPKIYVHMVEAGEHSGHLDDVLERLADYTENRRTLQQKVVLALIYPALLSLVAIGVVTGLLVSVVPQVTRVFLNTGQVLPLSTRLLMWFSGLIQGTPIFWVAGLAFFAWGGTYLRKIPKVNRTWDKMILTWPLAGKMVRGLNAARFTSTLGILTQSGVPLLNALQTSAQVITNGPMKEAVEKALKDVSEGRPLSKSLGESALFPPIVIHLIASGESSGNLDHMLRRAAENQSRELEAWVSALTALVEPLLILVMGGVVLFIVLAILSPIIEMNQLIR